MTYGELIEHAGRLHALASSRTGTRADLVQLRDLVPQLIDAVRALARDDVEMVPLPGIDLTQCELVEERRTGSVLPSAGGA
ncbi:hypothetical protein [Novosphingobium sp.]|jgi:hypothetical protein|uniref:hypothetical protein n=1 Tax=Novosphingobium sp. TaxID=1874826 RepID=UPI002FE2485B